MKKSLQKSAYLTIDDAPGKDFIKKVDYLVDNNIQAIFFCRGDYLEKRAEDVIYAIKKGFIISNHSYNHPRFSKITLEEASQQILKTDRIITTIYLDAGVTEPKKLFRFPYGDKGDLFQKEIQNILCKLGYKQPTFENINYDWFNNSNLSKDADIYWTYDLMEWCLKGNYEENVKTIDDVYNNMEKTEQEKGGSLMNFNSSEIILIHDHDETSKYFFSIIEKLLNMNIKFQMPLDLEFGK